MKSRLRFTMPVAAVLMAGSAMNSRAQTVTEVCNSASDTIQGSPYRGWRFTVSITTSTSPLQTRTLDLWLSLDFNQTPVVSVSGQLYSGITEQPIDLNIPNSPVGTGNCVGYAQTFSLLAKNGVPYGTRLGQYIILASDTYVLCCGGLGIESIIETSKGLVQFTDYDLSGNVLSVASGTFTGVTPNVPNIDNTNPFWSQTPQ